MMVNSLQYDARYYVLRFFRQIKLIDKENNYFFCVKLVTVFFVVFYFSRLIMGNFFSSVWNRLFGQKDMRILILGLDASGKTTILYQMHIGDVVVTVPTVGFNVETIQYKNIKFQVWDLGGQSSIRPYWRCYYQNTDAVVFVIDSADVDRLEIAKQELHSMLAEEELANAVLAVFANKQDLDGSLSPAEISEHLGLLSLKDRSWQIFKTSAIKGEGITEGMDWLATVLAENN
eukprot:GCRY01002772.1.p1 GENE.GCRY01002772.1~~GCRY01002772.1.p1  ORF type:complete len:232 (-),score=5.43 GCRY01002772.1:73-768(-)